MKVAAWLALAALALTGCNGTSGDSPNTSSTNTSPRTTTITGTAAVGRAVLSGQPVLARCDDGSEAQGKVADKGQWQVAVPIDATQCLFEIATTRQPKLLHGVWFKGDGTHVNVTPLTELILARALGKNPSELFSTQIHPRANDGSELVSRAAVQQAAQDIINALLAAGYEITDTNLLTQPFTPDGTGIDEVLDQVMAAISQTDDGFEGTLADISTGGEASLPRKITTSRLDRLKGTATAGPLTNCDAAAFPSADWTNCEVNNYANTLQNTTQHVDLTAGILQATTAYQADRLALLLNDPGRQVLANSCTGIATCPIDPRVQNWKDKGGVVKPVTFTARTGATLSGHVWATKDGADSRPGVVFINGSVIGFEQIYWYVAQTLARAGFIVMTFDEQGAGMSDQLGEAPDQLEAPLAGTPIANIITTDGLANNGLGGNALPFYDGGEDAINFFLSTPDHPYEPVPSRTSNTSHAAKQNSRVETGLNPAFNPLWAQLDSSRIGVSGHSYGAEAASWLVQMDDRLTTAVALDQLCIPTIPSPDEVTAVTQTPVASPNGVPMPAVYGIGTPCFGAPYTTKPEITKPALNITSDYALAPAPYLNAPGAGLKSEPSTIYSEAGVDSASIVVRSGTHYEYNDVPVAIPATLRGIDMVTWYTVAWFKKYLQHDIEGDIMLLSDRWRNDAATAQVDSAGDPNLLSWHYFSRMDITLPDGSRFLCEDLREGCADQIDWEQDGLPSAYSFDEQINSEQ